MTNVEQRNLTEWEQELASKYDDYCHYVKDGSLYARDLPLKRPMNNDGTFADDDDAAAVLAFCTFHGTIRVTDYCGEGPITDFSEEFRSRFLEYISDENNIELPK